MSGVVTAAGGAPIDGASVTVGSATVTTGADGRFELDDLPVGTATIAVSAPGFDPRSESVSLAEGSNVHDVVLTPTPTATVAGVVTAASGAAIEGASVTIGSATASTGVDGAFELDDLPVGSATIVTSAAGFESLSETVTLAAGVNTHDVVLTPVPVATVSGIVTGADGTAIEGATVTIGSTSSTTGADGRFELQNVNVGSATIITSAPGYETRTQAVTLNEGANVHDVALTIQTVFTYQNAVAYLPTEVPEYKAAIVFLPGLMNPSTGLPLDSRPLVLGTSGFVCSIWCPEDQRAQVRNRALELVGGDVALIGTTTLVDNPTSYETLLQALTQFATQSGHPELADIPLLIVGHSMGGCTAYGFTRMHAARVAGFITMKGGCHTYALPGAAIDVPGFFLIGDLDEEYRRENITAVFESGRAGSAVWALSTDAYQHGPILDFDLMFHWIDAVLTARLPETPGESLRLVTHLEGWLGNRSSGAIAPWACYDGNRSSASWLPTRETALDWQQMAGGSAIVEDC